MFGRHFNETADGVDYLKNTGALVTLGHIVEIDSVSVLGFVIKK